MRSGRRIPYAGSVHDDRELRAVTDVLRGGPQALRIGKNVRAFEQGIAELFGKRRGIMCNSGSSALYLAVELLNLAPGDEVVTSAVTFSTDIAPLVRAGAGVAVVDVEPDTYNVDVAALEEMVGPRTKAVLLPNLIGNAPDWDAVRALADRHGLRVVEDSCDAARCHAPRYADRDPLAHLRDVVRPQSHHHRGGHRRHGVRRRRGPGRPLPAAPPLGPPVRGPALRVAEGLRLPFLLDDRRRHRVRQPVHLRCRRVELRAVRARRGLRAGPAREAGGEPGCTQAELRPSGRALFAAARRVRPAPYDGGARYGVAHVPGPHQT